VVLAFLASQHHTLHMLVLAFAAGSAGMSFMTMYPAIRRAMLLGSLVMAGVALYQVRGRGRAPLVRAVGGASVAVTLGLVVWSVWRFGL
jgi:hypothetical protein